MNPLEQRRILLGIETTALARRARLTPNAVTNALQGQDSDPATLAALTDALGGNEDTHDFRQRTAHAKAAMLVRLTQGNMSLEGQGLRKDTLSQMIQLTTQELLHDNRLLWG